MRGLALGVLAASLAACSFDARYGGTRYRCDTSADCPDGLTCAADGTCGGGGAAGDGGDLGCPCSLWDDTARPDMLNNNDGNTIEVATKFRSDVSGHVTAIRFFKGDLDDGVHFGHLWSTGRQMLAEEQFVGETATGWQVQALSQPVTIVAGTTYLVSVYAPSGYYAADNSYFRVAHDAPPLHGLADGEDGSNGVFNYDEGFPDVMQHDASNYWVDVVFQND